MSLPTWKLVLDFGENSEFSSRPFKSDLCPCRYCWSEKCGTSLLRFSHFAGLQDEGSSGSTKSLEEPKWKFVLHFGDGSEFCSQPLKPDSCPCGFCWCKQQQSKRAQDFDLRSFQKFLSGEAADSLDVIFGGNQSPIVEAETEDERCPPFLDGFDTSGGEKSDVKSKDLKVELVKLEIEDDSQDENEDQAEDCKPKREVPVRKTKSMMWCRECGKAVQGNSAMIQHLKLEHDSTRPFKCCICTSRFETKKEKSMHFQKAHRNKDGRYKCNKCKFTCVYAGNITTHVRIHSKQKLFKCDQCDKEFLQLTNLSAHRKVIHAMGKAPIVPRQKQQTSIRKSRRQGRITGEISTAQLKIFADPDTPPTSTSTRGDPTKRDRQMGFFGRNENEVVDVEVPKAELSPTDKINVITAKNYEKTLKEPIGEPELETLTKKRRRLCPECGESFREQLELEQHLKRHHPTKPFKCCFCSARFGTRKQKVRHQMTHKDTSGRYKCIECAYSTTSTQNISRHLRSHTGEKPYKCDQCPKSFRQSIHLKNHVFSMHTDERPFQCDKCPRAFAVLGLLRHHQKNHCRKTLFKCSKCAKPFLMRKQLRDHKRIHPNCKPSQSLEDPRKKTFGCNQCAKSYLYLTNLHRHRRLVHGGQRASKPTLDNSHLEKLETSEGTHSSNVTKTQNSEIEVEDTKLGDAGNSQTPVQKVVRRKILNLHPKKASKKRKATKRTKSKLFSRNFSCHDCGKWFRSQEPLYQHLKKHNASKPFKCGFCSARFKTRKQEIAHRREHKSVDGRFHCQLCEFSRDYPWDVIRHMISHFPKEASSTSQHVDQKEEPLDQTKSSKLQTTTKSKLHQEQPAPSFKCSLCPSKFKTLKQKNIHVIKKHKDGEGLYVCNEDDCGYSCNLVSAMVKHMQAHPQKQVYRCALCGEPFNDLNELANHDRTVHIIKKLQKQFSSTAEENHNPKLKEQPEVQRLNEQNRLAEVGEPKNATVSLKSPQKSCTPLKVTQNKQLQTGNNTTRPFSCSLCKSRFQTKKWKNRHLRKHKNTNDQYQCRKCDFSAKLIDELVQHMGSHHPQQQHKVVTGSYKCDLCPRSYAFPHRLKRHQMSHTGERPYECDQCSKAFQTSDHLKRHKKTHLEVVPLLFDCNLCFKSFSEKCKLNRHMRGVH